MRLKVFITVVLAAIGIFHGQEVLAQTSTPEQEYSRYLTAAQKTPVSSSGDQVGLRDGSLSFSQTDVELPGIGPTIRIIRTFRPGNGLTGRDTSGNGMGAWELALPRLKTLTTNKANSYTLDSPHGWQTGNATDARCTEFGSPGTITRIKNPEPIEAESWWGGYQLVNDFGDEETVLSGGVGATHPGTIARTKSNWVINCLSSTSNGEPGEAFLATAPDGTRYWLDYLVYRFARSAGGVARYNASMLVTRVQDRFGNWVTYHYTAGALDAIDASDGRHVTLANAGAKIASITVTAASGNRTWQYQYDANSALTSVILPDGSSWQFTLDSLAQAYSPALASWGNCLGPVQNDGLTGTPITGSVTAPSGATTTYSMRLLHIGRSYVPQSCVAPLGGGALYALIPKDSWSYAITAKTVSGFGLPAATWTYNYSSGNSSWSSDCSSGCASTVWTDVTDPGGARNRSIYSNKYDGSENLLLRTETYAAQSGTLIRATDISYAISPHDETNSPYPWRALGVDTMLLRNNTDSTERWAPVLSTTTTQDGVSFNSAVNSYDSFARPLSVHRWSSLGYSRNDVTEYYDYLSLWVLGQTKRHYNVESGLVDVRNEYDTNTALTLQSYAFEKLKATMTYYADGTLATSKDGNNNTTTFSNWKRGIPRNIQFADGTGVSAVVDDNGWITAVTDENGFATGYGYDAMGRVSAITYPNETNLNYNTTTITFGPTTTSAYGLPAGYWQQITQTGNRKKVVYFDGLWRPVVEETYDTGNVAATLSQAVKRYDADGHLIFQSLPQRTQDANVYNTWGNPAATPNAIGVHTAYDSLDRVTQVQQDSELGAPVTTTAEYLTGFQVRTTNPRGYKTTNGYQVYGQPSYEQLAWSAQPENKDVTITRNYFGLPLTITQTDHTNASISVTRNYAYDGYMQLCKTLEPETGATLMDYDAAGNLAWHASGLSGGNYSNAGECTNSRVLAQSSGRRIDRSYDARNRALTLSFPDGVGNQSWQYTPDGLASQIITYNSTGNGTPVVNNYSYNHRRLLAGEASGQTGWYTWSIGYGYDANASVTANTYPDGFSTNFTNNALGQPVQVTSNWGTLASGVSYYPNGGISQFTYGNGVVHTMSQNARQLPARSADSGVINYSFTYDANANPTVIADDQRGGNYSRWLTYDGLDRLTDAGSCSFGGDCWHRIRYNALDNITSWTLGNGAKDYANYIYDTSNRLTQINNTAGTAVVSLSYDAQGNLAMKGGQGFQFDYGNRLRNAPGQESYRYDGLGRRVLQWSPVGGNILSMYASTGQVMFQQDQRQTLNIPQVYLGGSVLARLEYNYATSTGQLKYEHTDALGSPVAITNQAGQVIERTDYEPYGKVIGKPNNDRVGYTGHVMDSQTGLTYMQQRYYDSDTGRFNSADPVQANANAGTGFNRFAYAANNPYRFIDPDGRAESRPTSSTPRECEDVECKRQRQEERHRKDTEALGGSVWMDSSLDHVFATVNNVIERYTFRNVTSALAAFAGIGLWLQDEYGVEIGGNLVEWGGGYKVRDIHPGSGPGEVNTTPYIPDNYGGGKWVGILHTHPGTSPLSGSGQDGRHLIMGLGDTGQAAIHGVDVYVMKTNYTIQRLNLGAWMKASQAPGNEPVYARSFYEDL